MVLLGGLGDSLMLKYLFERKNNDILEKKTLKIDTQ
jgi:hypothetical protein